MYVCMYVNTYIYIIICINMIVIHEYVNNCLLGYLQRKYGYLSLFFNGDSQRLHDTVTNGEDFGDFFSG